MSNIGLPIGVVCATIIWIELSPELKRSNLPTIKETLSFVSTTAFLCAGGFIGCMAWKVMVEDRW